MSHDSRGALLQKGDRVLIEAVLTADPSEDNGDCNAQLQIVTPEQTSAPPMLPPTLSAINTRMLTKIGAAVLLLIFGLLAFAPVEAQARGGKGFLRGWGLRKVLPRNWGNRNNSAACQSCNTQAACQSCNTQAACNTCAPQQAQAQKPKAPALVDARPIQKPAAVPVAVESPEKVFSKAEYCNASFENASRAPIVVVFWHDSQTGAMETGNYRPGTVDTSRGMKYEITARNCVVHPEMKYYAAQVAVRLNYDIYVRADGRQEIVMRSE